MKHKMEDHELGHNKHIQYQNDDLVFYTDQYDQIYVIDKKSRCEMEIKQTGHLDGGLQFAITGAHLSGSHVAPIIVAPGVIEWRVTKGA